MKKSFEINVNFDEKGEELERLIIRLLINILDKNKLQNFHHLNI